MNKKYKEGDLVVLKSGGPVMTVTDTSPGGEHVWCQWFPGKKLEKGHFPIIALEPPKEDAR